MIYILDKNNKNNYRQKDNFLLIDLAKFILG